MDYLKIIDLITDWGNSHYQVQRVHHDFPDQLGVFATEGKAHPVLYLAPGQIEFLYAPQTRTTLNNFQLNIYCMDLIQEDRANIGSILNTTSLILGDLYKWISEEDLPGIGINRNATIRPLNNWALDSLAGWQMALSLQIQDSTWCQIPLSTPVTL